MPYNTRDPRATLMASGNWFPITELYKLMNDAKSKNLQTVAERLTIHEALNSIKRSPFDNSGRFVAPGDYISECDGAWMSLLSQLRKALQSKDRQGEIAARQAANAGHSNISYVAEQDASQSLWYAMNGILQNLMEGTGAWNARTYEQRYPWTG